jgi:hypothetical protein
MNTLDTGEGSDATAMQNIATDLANNLSNIDTNQLESLLSTARLATNQLERTLNDKKAELEEFSSKEKPTGPDGTELTPEEVESKKKQLQYEIDAIERKISLRDLKLPLVEAWVEKAQARLAEYELHARSAMDGDPDLRRFVLRELLVEIPSEMGRMIRDARDEFAPESEVEEYTGRADLIQADLTARQNSKAKDAADTRKDNLEGWIAEQREGRDHFGLQMIRGDREYTWERLITESRYLWLETVDGAKQFLENPGNAAGSTSSLLKRPGKGYLVLRLVSKTPKYAQGKLDAKQRVIELAAQRRARELCVKALRKLRAEVLDRGWDEAYATAKAKYGDALSVKQTVWFKENEDIPGLYSHNDNDVLKVSSSPSATSPDAPFVQALKDIKPKEGITEIVPHKYNEDPLRRPDHDKWGYLLARVKDRRALTQRLEKDDFKDSATWGNSPADIWRNRHLAASDLVRSLIEPSRVLEGHDIIQYKTEKKEDEKKEEPSS